MRAASLRQQLEGERVRVRSLEDKLAAAVRARSQGVVCYLRGDSARQVLRGLRLAGLRVVRQERSAHGSDCGDCPTGGDERASGLKPIRGCRCIRAMRLRVGRDVAGQTTGGDWLLLFGDMNEGPVLQLRGPYPEGAPLDYGGGLWREVSL